MMVIVVMMIMEVARMMNIMIMYVDKTPVYYIIHLFFLFSFTDRSSELQHVLTLKSLLHYKFTLSCLFFCLSFTTPYKTVHSMTNTPHDIRAISAPCIIFNGVNNKLKNLSASLSSITAL